MKKILLLTLFVTLLPAVAFSQKTDPKFEQSRNELVGALKSAGSFDTLIGLVQIAGLNDLGLHDNSQVTLLAPNDAAFAKLPKGTLDALKKDPKKLRAFLMGHTVEGKILIQDMLVPAKPGSTQTFKEVRSRKGDTVGLLCDGHTGEHHPRINNGASRIGRGDIVFSKGVVHEIETAIVVDDGGKVK